VSKPPQKTAVFLFVLLEVHNYFFGASLQNQLLPKLTLPCPLLAIFKDCFSGITF
jgi:hypothetical protein